MSSTPTGSNSPQQSNPSGYVNVNAELTLVERVFCCNNFWAREVQRSDIPSQSQTVVGVGSKTSPQIELDVPIIP